MASVRYAACRRINAGSSEVATTPTEPGGRGPHLVRGLGDHGAAAPTHALEACERHHHRIVAGEADHLGRNKPVPAGFDHNAGADRHGVNGTCDLDHQAAHAHHTA